MLTISKPLSAGQAAAYHASEFTSAEQSYYTQSGQVRGEWHGRLAAKLGLTGEVSAEAFSHLASGQHPETAEQLVRYQQAREYVNDAGEAVRTMEHRAGWDATFSAPKSISLTALVGGDERIRGAHREAVRTALDELETMSRRGSVATLRRRPPAGGLPPASSTTARDRWTDTPRRSFTPT